jgi:hypothetical protein
MTAFPNASTSETSCFNRCNARRKAVFLPMPGSFASSLTAFSSSFEGYEFNGWFFLPQISQITQILSVCEIREIRGEN